MPNYPFTRAKPLGWAIFEILTSAQMNAVDSNAAQAADGLVWTDVAQFRNWTPMVAVSQSGSALLYSSFSDIWYAIGVSGGALTNAIMWGGGGVFVAGPSSPVNGITSIAARAAVYDSVNNQLVVGVTPTASSNQKYRRATGNGTASWGAGTSSATNTNGVACIGFSQPLGMLVAGHLVSGLVETSVDGGLTWTARTTPNADVRQSIATGTGPSNPGIVITTSAVQNRLIHSTDGINWAQRSLPAAAKYWQNVVWVPLRGEFVAITENLDDVAYSTDGITWTTRARTLPPGIAFGSVTDVKLVAFGRTIFGVLTQIPNNLYVYSQDGGASWKVAGTAPAGATIGPLASSGKQLMYSLSTNVQWTLATGF